MFRLTLLATMIGVANVIAGIVLLPKGNLFAPACLGIGFYLLMLVRPWERQYWNR